MPTPGPDSPNPDQPETSELRRAQLGRERAEAVAARESIDDEETAQHERRADKARYLREKLEERAESEGSDSDLRSPRAGRATCERSANASFA